MTSTNDNRLQDHLDREILFDLVRRERFARDQRRFDVMAACFHRDAYVRTSWYDGTGGDAYVEASRKWMSNTGNSKHWVFPAFAQVQGDRATVESPAMIFNRAKLEGVEIDFRYSAGFSPARFAKRGNGNLPASMSCSNATSWRRCFRPMHCRLTAPCSIPCDPPTSS